MSKLYEKILGLNFFYAYLSCFIKCYEGLIETFTTCLGHGKIVFLKVSLLYDHLRGVFRTLSNVSGGSFFGNS